MSHPATETSYFSMLWEVNFYVKLLCVHVSTFWGKKLGEGGGEGTWPLPMLRPWLKYFILNFILTCNTYSHVYTGNRPLWVVFSFVFLILNIWIYEWIYIKFVIFLHTYTHAFVCVSKNLKESVIIMLCSTLGPCTYRTCEQRLWWC